MLVERCAHRFYDCRNKKPADIVTITKQELTVYTDYNYIPTSHIVMYDHENIALACTIFKELTRYSCLDFVLEL